jgi:hypothetical protein
MQQVHQDAMPLLCTRHSSVNGFVIIMVAQITNADSPVQSIQEKAILQRSAESSGFFAQKQHVIMSRFLAKKKN